LLFFITAPRRFRQNCESLVIFSGRIYETTLGLLQSQQLDHDKNLPKVDN